MARVAPAPVRIEDCSMVKALEAIGEHWTLLVLREAFYEVRRFEEMRAHLGVARNVLTLRLSRLVEAGILERIPYQEEGQRTRHEYRLSRKGARLLPALMALTHWADEFMPHPDGRPLALRHAETGQAVRVELVRQDGQRVRQRELEAVYWPDRKQRKPSKRPRRAAGSTA